MWLGQGGRYQGPEHQILPKDGSSSGLVPPSPGYRGSGIIGETCTAEVGAISHSWPPRGIPEGCVYMYDEYV